MLPVDKVEIRTEILVVEAPAALITQTLTTYAIKPNIHCYIIR